MHGSPGDWSAGLEGLPRLKHCSVPSLHRRRRRAAWPPRRWRRSRAAAQRRGAAPSRQAPPALVGRGAAPLALAPLPLAAPHGPRSPPKLTGQPAQRSLTPKTLGRPPSSRGQCGGRARRGTRRRAPAAVAGGRRESSAAGCRRAVKWRRGGHRPPWRPSCRWRTLAAAASRCALGALPVGATQDCTHGHSQRWNGVLLVASTTNSLQS